MLTAFINDKPNGVAVTVVQSASFLVAQSSTYLWTPGGGQQPKAQHIDQQRRHGPLIQQAAHGSLKVSPPAGLFGFRTAQ